MQACQRPRIEELRRTLDVVLQLMDDDPSAYLPVNTYARLMVALFDLWKLGVRE